MDIFPAKEIFGLLMLSFITLIIHSLFTNNPRRKLPPGPRGWPILGALPLLGPKPHVTLAKMAKKYGPVMYLNLGTSGKMVIASSPDSARAFLKTLDTNFSNRAPNSGATHLAYDSQDLVFADYGPRWKLLRKLSINHVLGGKALEGWAPAREAELRHMVRAMRECSESGEAVVVPQMLAYAMTNMLSRVILSRRLFGGLCPESYEFKEMVAELMTVAGYFNVGDFMPAIKWMDLQGIQRGMKKLHKRFDGLLTKVMKEHAASAHQREGNPDFLDVLMQYNKEDSDGERVSLANIKGLLLNIFTAGTDTSSSTIEWALAEMLRKPSIFKRAHEEMDQVIGRDRPLQESDLPKLPYLQAICKESFRKHPSTPLNLPRISSEACEVDGYYIPKNTRLNVNIWAIGRDPDVWENPLDFNPERFLSRENANIALLGNDFKLIPFGYGRRICTGARMGIVFVQYILGTLVHSFEWSLPSGAAEVNMDEVFGLAVQKAVPLSAMVTPRLASSAY